MLSKRDYLIIRIYLTIDVSHDKYCESQVYFRYLGAVLAPLRYRYYVPGFPIFLVWDNPGMFAANQLGFKVRRDISGLATTHLTVTKLHRGFAYWDMLTSPHPW